MIQKLWLDTQILHSLSNITPDFVQAELDKNAMHRRETQELHMSYEEETKMLLCIKNGDVAGLLDLLLEISSQGAAVGLTGHDDLLNSRNLLAAAVAMFTRAAIEGGMDNELALDLSDAYLISACKINDKDMLFSLLFHSGLDFANRVRKSKASRSLPIKQCCEYIGNHLHDKITLSELAGHCSRAECYVSSTFKRQLGVSPHEYIRNEKLEAARKMLLSTALPVSDISAQYGFCTHSNFTLRFREKFGVSPSEYRMSFHSVAWESL